MNLIYKAPAAGQRSKGNVIQYSKFHLISVILRAGNNAFPNFYLLSIITVLHLRKISIIQ